MQIRRENLNQGLQEMQTYNIIESIETHEYGIRILKGELLGKCYKFLCSISDIHETSSPIIDQYDENRILFEPVKLTLEIKGKDGRSSNSTSIEAISFLRVHDKYAEFKLHKNKNHSGHLSVTLVSDDCYQPWDLYQSEDYWRIWRTGIDIETGRAQHIEYKFKQPDFLVNNYEHENE